MSIFWIIIIFGWFLVGMYMSLIFGYMLARRKYIAQYKLSRDLNWILLDKLEKSRGLKK